MRDNKWLENRLDYIWESFFPDIKRANKVVIKFGKKARRQLGSIKWVDQDGKGLKVRRSILKKIRTYRFKPKSARTQITITSYFKDEKVPDFVVDATISHELCHYAHGFSSPLKQIYNHPHKGNVVGKELSRRGIGELEKDAKDWLKDNWVKVIKTHN